MGVESGYAVAKCRSIPFNFRWRVFAAVVMEMKADRPAYLFDESILIRLGRLVERRREWEKWVSRGALMWCAFLFAS